MSLFTGDSDDVVFTDEDRILVVTEEPEVVIITADADAFRWNVSVGDLTARVADAEQDIDDLAAVDATLQPLAQKDQPGGYVGLDGSGYIDEDVLPPGVANAHYTHNQATPGNPWVINHNLGFKPGGLYVEDSGGTQLAPSVTHISNNTVQLDFVGATDGFAILS